MREAIFGNPKTTIIGALCVLTGVMLWTGKLDVNAAVIMLTFLLGGLGAVSKQVDKGASVSTAEADRALASVQMAEKQGIIETAPTDAKPSDAQETRPEQTRQ